MDLSGYGWKEPNLVWVIKVDLIGVVMFKQTCESQGGAHHGVLDLEHSRRKQ